MEREKALAGFFELRHVKGLELEVAFNAFHATHPQVYEKLLELALEALEEQQRRDGERSGGPR